MAEAAKGNMPLAVLGRSGLVVSRLAYGAWVSFGIQLDVDKSALSSEAESEGAYQLMVHAFKAGINLFDNAEVYANGQAEIVMGECIQRGINENVWVRERSNVKGLSRKHIHEGLAASLSRLQLEYVDILLCHRPDPVTPMEEIVRAVNAAIERNQCLYWGTSMWSALQIAEAMHVCDTLGLIRPITEQPEYNLFGRSKLESEYLPLFRQYGLGTTVFSPLASGILTGKYASREAPSGSRLSLPSNEGIKNAKFGKDSYQIDKAEQLRPLAARLQCSLAQLAIAWTLKNDNCTSTILGATKISQLEENLGALDVVPKLTPEIMAEIDAVVGVAPPPTRIELQTHGIRGTATLHGLFR